MNGISPPPRPLGSFGIIHEETLHTGLLPGGKPHSQIRVGDELQFPSLDDTLTRSRVPANVTRVLQVPDYIDDETRRRLLDRYNNRQLTLEEFCKYLYYIKGFSWADIKELFLKMLNVNGYLVINWNNPQKMKTLTGILKKNPQKLLGESLGAKPTITISISTSLIDYFCDEKFP